MPGARARCLAPFLAVAAVTAALYAPQLDHPFLWDDNVQIVENPAVRDGVALRRYFLDRGTTSIRDDYNTRIYRPLRNLAMRGLWRISDVAPQRRSRVFLGANLALYLVGGWLVLLLCVRLGGDRRAALAGAALWLLLPVHAEDVLYASAFGDLLSMVLQLGGLLAAIDALAAPPRRGALAASLALFALALLVKEMAITSALLVPAYVLSERRALLRDPSGRRRVVALAAGHVLLAVAYVAVRTAILGRVGQADVTPATVLHGVAFLPWLLLLNLEVALMPLGHAPDYGRQLHGAAAAAGAAIVVVAAAAVLLRRPWGGARFGAVVFALALAPVLQLVPMWTLLADRFLLVPSVGLAIAASAVVAWVGARRRPLALALVAVSLLVCAGGLAIERRRFRDDMVMWAYAVEAEPRSWLSHHNLGLMLLKAGQPGPALDHLLLAEELGGRHATLYLHLAGALEAVGRLDDAARAAEASIAREPDDATAYAQLASIRRARGDVAGAWAALRGAEARGLVADPIQRAALLRADPARREEALAAYRALTDRFPRDPLVWIARGELALALDRREEAAQAAARCGDLPACARLRAEISPR